MRQLRSAIVEHYHIIDLCYRISDPFNNVIRDPCYTIVYPFYPLIDPSNTSINPCYSVIDPWFPKIDLCYIVNDPCNDKRDPFYLIVDPCYPIIN